MIPLHSITLFCDSPDFGSCLFFVSGQQRLYPCYFLRFQLIGRYQIFVIFYSAALHLFLELLDLIFYSLFFHPLELFFCLFFLVFLGLLRPYLVLESHLVFLLDLPLVFLDFQFHYLCLDLFPVLFGFQNPYLVLELHLVFLQGLFQVLIYCLALVEFLYRVLLQVLFPVSVLRLDFL